MRPKSAANKAAACGRRNNLSRLPIEAEKQCLARARFIGPFLLCCSSASCKAEEPLGQRSHHDTAHHFIENNDAETELIDFTENPELLSIKTYSKC